MSDKRLNVSSVLGFGLLALVLCAPVLWAGSPAQEVILESSSTWDFVQEHVWTGPAIIWIEGVRYEGEIFYHGEGKTNWNGWHGTEYHDYYFPDLGWLYLSGTGQTFFAFVTPEHRWHRYSSHVKITGGTGVFTEAHGVFQLVGYTNWLLPPYHLPPEAFAFTGGTGMIGGIEMN
jgi:hypothetical protein